MPSPLLMPLAIHRGKAFHSDVARMRIIFVAFFATAALRAGVPTEPGEFAELQRQISAHRQWDQPRLRREACRPEALLFDQDRTPVDIVWRRTWAPGMFLGLCRSSTGGAPGLGSMYSPGRSTKVR